MKKIFLLTILLTMIFSASICAAKDIWVDRWESEGVDVYVMENTIAGNNERNYSLEIQQISRRYVAI